MRLALPLKLFRTCGVVAGLFVALVTGSHAQTMPDDSQRENAREAIEEIVVTSEKPIVVLRYEMRMAEQDVFEMFNEFNTDDDFDVDCGIETRRDLVSWDWACRPNYEKTLRSEEGVRMLNGFGNMHADARIMHKNKQLKKKMEALMRERPEFLQLLLKLADATDALEQEREKRCRGRIFCRKTSDASD